MKTFFTLIVLSFFIFFAANTFAADADLTGCWDVNINYIDSHGVDGAEHNTIKIIQPNDNRFYGFVSNLPDTEEGRDFSGIVVKKDVYITHWDSITKASLSGNGKEFSGINQAFNESDGGIDVKDSITASATAIRLDTDACCDEEKNYGETDTDCGGPCAPCFTDMDCLENADCLSGDCRDTGSGLVCQE